jgi:hypothetical protein
VIRRTFIALAAACAFVLPTAAIAQAYPPPPADMEVSDPTPAVGQTIIVEIEGAVGATATLSITFDDSQASEDDVEIAGVKSLSKTIPSSGVATFRVTLHAPGTYTFTAFVDGQRVEVQTVTAHAVGVGGQRLSDTGVSAMPLILGAGGLILAGGGAVVLAARRRQRESVDA